MAMEDAGWIVGLGVEDLTAPEGSIMTVATKRDRDSAPGNSLYNRTMVTVRPSNSNSIIRRDPRGTQRGGRGEEGERDGRMRMVFDSDEDPAAATVQYMYSART